MILFTKCFILLVVFLLFDAITDRIDKEKENKIRWFC